MLGYGVPGAQEFLYGDADRSGFVGYEDVGRLLSVAGGLAAIIARPEGDVAPTYSGQGFGDGMVDLKDAIRVLRYLNGLEPDWP